jgi:hypothetical protein
MEFLHLFLFFMALLVFYLYVYEDYKRNTYILSITQNPGPNL